MRIRSLTLILFCISLLFGFSKSTTRLLDKDWVFRIDDGVYPAFVPSTAIDILIKNSVLQSDFYYRDNFLQAYRYETKDSTYTLNFFAAKD